MIKQLHFRFVAIVGLAAIALFGARPAYAHCDTMAGPVVRAARHALETGDVSQALRWVRPQDEAEVTEAFTVARRSRAAAPDSAESSDRRFFETVVRLHRAGEGEPYDGLKETMSDPALSLADKALENGDVSLLTAGISDEGANEIRKRFVRALQARQHADESVAAGREYVRAYVDFIHYAAEGKSDHDTPEPSQKAATAGDASVTQVVIEQFSADETRLKKNESTKLRLGFRSDQSDIHVAWRLTCSGVAITGWNAPQLLSVSERNEGGAIQSVHARDYLVNDKPVIVVVKRLKTSTGDDKPQCTATLLHEGTDAQEKSIVFEPR